MYKKMLFSALFLFSLVNPAFSENVEKIILDKKSNEDPHFLVFSAAEGTISHAFVIWGVEDSSRLLSSFSAWGLYPKDRPKKLYLFGKVPGKIVDECNRTNMFNIFNRLIVEVNKATYNRARSIKDNWQYSDNLEYQLLSNDCVAFMNAVAKEIGLQTPTGLNSLFPQLYVKKLIELNATQVLNVAPNNLVSP